MPGIVVIAALSVLGGTTSLAARPPGASFATPDKPAPSFTVVIRPETDAQQRVDAITIVEQIEPADANHALVLSAPLSLSGLTPIATRVSDLTISDDRGQIGVTVTDTKLADGEDGRRWTAARPVGRGAVVRYRIALDPVPRRGPPYAVKAAGFGIAGNTSTLLVLPEGSNAATSTLSWDLSQLPASSIGVVTGGVGTVTIAGPPANLLDRWLLAGPATVGHTKQESRFNAYTIGTPPFDAQSMMNWSRTAYAALADGFGYLGTPRYELLIRALDVPSYATGTANLVGGGSLIATGNAYVAGQDEHAVKSVIFHEMGHQWVGQLAGGGGLWFAEGLNVYITTTLLCEAGLEKWTVCADLISKWAKDYYASEGRTWSQAAIEASPFDREDLRLVSYSRGMLYFANLDATLLARSGGKTGLLATLRPLFDARTAGRPITTASWEHFLREKLGGPAVATFRREVVQGELIDPLPNAFGPHLTRTPAQWTVAGEVRRGYIWRSRPDPGGERLRQDARNPVLR